MKKTIPSWATLSASQLARAQKQTPMASSPRPKMDAILTEAIKASYFMQSTQVCLLQLSLFESSLFCPDVRNSALFLKGYSSQEASFSTLITFDEHFLPFRGRVFLRSPACPGSFPVDQAGLERIDLPALLPK